MKPPSRNDEPRSNGVQSQNTTANSQRTTRLRATASALGLCAVFVSAWPLVAEVFDRRGRLVGRWSA
jgi:hypothetical protein